jgi:ATP-dependent RNA helicase RhlE
MHFDSFELDPNINRGIADLGFSKPTPIQERGITPILNGEDVLGTAMTGSGKTAAFALPIIHRLLKKPRGTTRALVLSPTRELAAQIVEHFNTLGRHTPIRAAAVFGGVGMAPQEKALKNGIDVIVACPGRLLDHMQYPYARLAGLDILVLDEADRMLDMGFLPDIRRILNQLPKVSQTLFFSATMPQPIVKLADRMLHKPAVINISRQAAPAHGISQTVYPVPQNLKPSLLLALVDDGAIRNALVFTRTKHRANRLARFLEKGGVAADRIHGNRSQTQRTKALADFKRGTTQVLVATDVAARGIDIEALSHVVNLDVPHVPEDYIHRVGRTARAGATGEAFTFFSPDERRELMAIERKIGKKLPRITVDNFDYDAQPSARFEIPIGERIAQMRAQRSEERARSRAKADRKSDNIAAHGGAKTQQRSETAKGKDERDNAAPGPPRRKRRRSRRGPGARGPAQNKEGNRR